MLALAFVKALEFDGKPVWIGIEATWRIPRTLLFVPSRSVIFSSDRV